MTLQQIIVVVVGFRVNQERSVLYKKLDTPSDRQLGEILNVAFHDRKCDFVSVRRIPKETAKP